MMVAAGLPVKFATRIRSVCDVTLARHLVALVFNRLPTPPVAAPTLLRHEVVVISVLPRILSYLVDS